MCEAKCASYHIMSMTWRNGSLTLQYTQCRIGITFLDVDFAARSEQRAAGFSLKTDALVAG